MRKVFFCLFYFFVIFSLNAKTEIDKAFKIRGNDNSDKFILYSPDSYDGKEIREEQVYDNFGCDGKNLSPKLVWSGVPKDTKSFAITMYDKDAKTGSGWWHWILYNIPSNVRIIETGANKNKSLLPKGSVYGMNDYGKKEYGGACPPAGSKHNYVITLYALNVEELDLPRNATPAMVGLYLNNHKIKTANIHVFYKRNAEVIYKQNNINSNRNSNRKYRLNSGKSVNSSTKKNNIRSSKNMVIEEK